MPGLGQITPQGLAGTVGGPMVGTVQGPRRPWVCFACQNVQPAGSVGAHTTGAFGQAMCASCYRVVQNVSVAVPQFRGLGQATTSTDSTSTNAALIAGQNANKVQTVSTTQTNVILYAAGALVVGGLVAWSLKRRRRRR